MPNSVKELQKVAQIATFCGVAYFLNEKMAISHDLAHYSKGLLALLQSKYNSFRNKLTPDLFEEAVGKFTSKTAILYEGKSFSFLDCERECNRVAFWGLKMGLKPGDKVSLFMQNRPEFFFIWMGLAKIGVVTALLNSNIRKKGLLHCIGISKSKFMIYGSELTQIIDEVRTDLGQILQNIYCNIDVYRPVVPDALANQPANDFLDLNSPVLKDRVSRPDRIQHRKNISPSDPVLLIYTSGTTGLPKAATVEHQILGLRSLIFTVMTGIRASDRIYCCLPLYHTSGGNLGVGMMLNSGATLVLARKFSASKFWVDVRQYECTIVQYIGELCRYLVAQPPSIKDTENHVRIAVGNGLRPDIWQEFQNRFRLPEVHEFYGSTEGTIGLYNACKSPEDAGCLGRTGFCADFVTGIKLVKFNVEDNDYARTKDGFLIECDVNEPGELICPIGNFDPSRKFQGYYGDEESSKKKILHDVFKKGDAYYHTGDLLRKDENRRWYFVDRIGDTFRWKGENVSTSEVAEVLSVFDGLDQVNVYGVELPGHEGRACMAAVQFQNDSNSFDWPAFVQHVKNNLPSYARPLFLREVKQMEVTGTMKLQKTQLRKQGIQLGLHQDCMWVFDEKSNQYHEWNEASRKLFLPNPVAKL